MRAARYQSDLQKPANGGWHALSTAYRALAISLVLATALGGCVLAPHGTGDEHAKLKAAAPPFESRIEVRQIPELPAVATWQDVLSRGFLANGELESSYFEWKAAFARIDQAATWPNTNVALSFGYMFSPGNMKTWDRTTIGAGFDSSMNLSLPVKTRTAGKVALDAARAAEDRFRTVKFDLQRRILQAYLDLALTEELIRIERDNLTFLKLLSDSASDRAAAGGPMQDLFKALIESETAQNDLAGLEVKTMAMRGELNGMLGREPSAPLTLPANLPAPRPVAADDASLIAVAVTRNPELAALAQQVAGRTDAVELARLAYLPDIIPSASITGSISQSLGAMLMVPTKLPAIRAAIDEAQSMTRSSEAMLRQTTQDRAARFVADLYLMRNAERETQLYRTRVVPSARQLVSSSRDAYAAGTIVFADLIDSERMFISVRRMVAQSQIEREERLADLEALAGVDIETLGGDPSSAGNSPTVGKARTE
jgi:outer membrane protein TolC